MKKSVLLILSMLISLNIFAESTKSIYFGEEGESILYYTPEELYFALPYVGEYAKLDKSLLAVDKDGFLKFKCKEKTFLIIDGDFITQYFTDFQNDGENRYSEGEGDFHNYNIKDISASSYFSETIKGRKISYTSDNLYKCFYVGCKCHPYWWNDTHIPWVEGAKGNGIGESITIEYKVPVTGISILNGYVDINNMKLYKENSRLKEIEIVNLETGKKKNISFEDKVYFNYITFDEPLTKIKIIIKDVYKGSKYTDTCVSAIIDHTRNISNEYFEKWLNENKEKWHLENQEIVLSDFAEGKNLFKSKY